MVFPLFDDNSQRRRFPLVNYCLIAANVYVFLVLQDAGSPNNHFTYAWATVPEEILTGRDVVTESKEVIHPLTGQRFAVPGLQPTPISVYLTLLVSMFMHGGWAHLLGNMLFLWIFGDNVEDYLGAVRYLLFYLVCGVIASLCHVGVAYAFHRDLDIPCLGASGAISGVLGGYLLLFPMNRVTVILFRFLTEVPAFVAIGIWFLFQLVYGLGALGDASGGGVAYGAHIGGFIAGLGLVSIFSAGQHPPPWRDKLGKQPPGWIRRAPW
ncbi:MAG: rhomboid family intramembrane serine protease [Gemmataceae bacterium]|nr:rhomboid family intramembrane serine protease [Gemmataceae bacterium]